MRRKLLAVALLIAFSAPAFAEDASSEEVSDDVDITFWCGAAFTVAAMQEDAKPEDVASSNALAEKLFGQAAVALEADGVEESEHDRLMDDYIGQAIAQVREKTEEPRYTVDECTTRAAAE